uniref:Retrovirus-related Pol polyprotein from transposon TNT 1-94 n=1 Tax=Tanacetum cinerariifolium TaxID=118510 RepID=A0A699H339_TANCI|nr:retrovirus-related Pol polyprotein from transposon TNT 1-94 [Tanacetum cinerariifolium]
MKAILRKDKCLAAIGERPAEVTDDSKWDEMDGNAVANLYLALADGVLSSLEEKKNYLVFDDVATAILEKENSRNNREDRQTSSRHVEALVVTRGRLGYFRKDCWGLNTSYHQGNIASTSKDCNALCCEAAVANESMKRFSYVWLFDTGATFHMTARSKRFHQYKPISGGGSVYSCNDHELKIIGIGSIMVKMHDGGNTKQDHENYKMRTCTYERRKGGCKLIPAERRDNEGGGNIGMKILVERKLLPGLTKKIKCLRMDNGGEYTGGDSTTRETTLIQKEKEFQSNDSFEAAPQHEVNETNESQAPATRTLNRKRRRRGWHSDYVMESNVAYCLLTEEGEPSTLQEALNNLDALKPIGNKWVYKIKKNSDDQVERYRARLVVKGYAQKEGIDFNEIFSPVVLMTTIRVVMALRATYDLHLDQLDVKTVFLYGNLDEEIYMLQPEDKVSRKIRLSQKSYVKKIMERFNMQDCKLISTMFPTNVKLSSKMSPNSEKKRMEMSRVSYASAVGSLMFAMICTRPDIVHVVGVVSWYIAKPGREHWEAMKRILRYIKVILDVALCFGDLDLIVIGYVDSDYAVVAMSTTKAEYVAAAQASKEAVWLKMLLEELGYKQEKITLFCDNQRALYLARNLAFHSKIKHIRVQYYFVREKVEEGTVDIQKIYNDDNVANYLTKEINCDKFIWCRSSCGLAKM